MILAGDIGGTSSRLGLFRLDGNKVNSILECQYDSQKSSSLENLVTDFLNKIQVSELSHQEKHIHIACFGIAGPVKQSQNGCCYVEMTNIPQWPLIEEQNLSELLNGVSVTLLNDMAAICYGTQVLNEQDVLVLNSGRPQLGNQALIAAGTGLGEAMLYWDGKTHHPVPSEGSHADFASRNAEEMALSHYLLKKSPYVSYEQVVSGPGLVRIYEFLRDNGDYEQEQEDFKQRLLAATSENGADNRPALISEAGLNGEDALSVKALDMFVSLYGAEAGNIALKYLAFNGVYIGGGIAPKIKNKLREGLFMQSFTAKEGKFAELTAAIPVKVILNPNIGLIGAAWCAASKT